MLDSCLKFYAAVYPNPLRNLEVKVTDLEISSCLKCFIYIYISQSSEIILIFIVYIIMSRGIMQSNFHRFLQKVNWVIYTMFQNYMHNIMILAEVENGHKSVRYLLFFQNHDIYTLDTKCVKMFNSFTDILFTMSLAIKCLTFGKGYNSVKYSQKSTTKISGPLMCPDCMPHIMVLAQALTCSSGSQEITLLYKKLLSIDVPTSGKYIDYSTYIFITLMEVTNAVCACLFAVKYLHVYACLYIHLANCQ